MAALSDQLSMVPGRQAPPRRTQTRRPGAQSAASMNAWTWVTRTPIAVGPGTKPPRGAHVGRAVEQCAVEQCAVEQCAVEQCAVEQCGAGGQGHRRRQGQSGVLHRRVQDFTEETCRAEIVHRRQFQLRFVAEQPYRTRFTYHRVRNCWSATDQCSMRSRTVTHSEYFHGGQGWTKTTDG